MLGQYWKIARGAGVFIFFYLSGALYGVTVLPLVSLATRDPAERPIRCQRAVARAMCWIMDLLRLVRIFSFNTRRVDPRLPDHAVIVVANHPTTLDVVAVLSVYPGASVVVKQKIWRDPFLRPMFYWCGHIQGSDGSMADNKRLLADIEARLQSGVSVVVFPEGSRSPAGGLGTLHKGAFAVASLGERDLLPVVITCQPPVLHKEAPWHVLPDGVVQYDIVAGDLVSGTDTTARKLQKHFDRFYRRELGLPGPAANN